MKRANETPASPAHAYANIKVEPGLRTSQQPATSTASTPTASTATSTIMVGGMGCFPTMTGRTGTTLWPAAPMPFHLQAQYPADPNSIITGMDGWTYPALWPAAPLPFHPQAQYPTYPNYQLQPQPRAMANVVQPALHAPGIPVFLAGQRLLPPPAAQPASAPARLAGDQGGVDVFDNRTLDLLVKTEISNGLPAWKETLHSLKGQERTNFLIVSFPQIAGTYGSAGHWNCAIRMIMEMVDMATMLAQKWPNNLSFLHLLAGIKDHEWIDLALARDGVPQSLHSSDMAGLTPLHWAAITGKKKVVQAMLSHDDEAGSLRLKKNKANSIPLHMACQAGHGSTVALLLSSKGKEQRLSADSLGRFPIHSALIAGGVGALPYLLAECAMEQVSAQAENGWNALMLAICVPSPKAVKMLLDIPGTLAVQLGARDSEGLGAIDHARLQGNAEVIALIEAAMQTAPNGASSTTSTGSTSTGNGATRLQPAVGTEPPVPMTPYPSTPAPAEQSGFSDTEDDASVL